MADRTVYGNDWSENGWRMVDRGSCVWVTVPGADVQLQIREGQPAAILGAFVADWNAYIEPVRDADSACWTEGNSVPSSNHLSGTACDVCWNSHPFRVANAGFNAAQIATMREMLAYYEDTVFWGNDWDNPKDAMHVQMGYDTYGSENVARVNDFIARKIRADGFSTFRRGNAAQPNDPALILSRATGLDLNRATEILPTMKDGLKQADCTNANRIAMFIAQTGHESANFERTEEYASGAAYEGRCDDLGNCSPGDGVRYKGRTWIQITGRHNYGEFSEWAYGKGLVPTPEYFVDRPVELEDLKWAGTGAAWYWTVARGTRINEASDRRDLVTVTQLINGGQNGIDDRRVRYNRALAVGDQLLALITGDDDELADPDIQRMIRELHGAMFNKVASQSLYATPGEGPRWQLHEMVKNQDGLGHEGFVEREALRGNPDELARVVLVAQGQGVVREQWAVQRAQRVLAEIEATNPAALQNYLASKGQA